METEINRPLWGCKPPQQNETEEDEMELDFVYDNEVEEEEQQSQVIDLGQEGEEGEEEEEEDDTGYRRSNLEGVSNERKTELMSVQIPDPQCNVDNILCCPLCKYPARVAVKCSNSICTAIFCYSCKEQAIAQSGNQCPVCRKKEVSFSYQSIVQQQINAIQVLCPLCEKVTPYGEYFSHIQLSCVKAKGLEGLPLRQRAEMEIRYLDALLTDVTGVVHGVRRQSGRERRPTNRLIDNIPRPTEDATPVAGSTNLNTQTDRSAPDLAKCSLRRSIQQVTRRLPPNFPFSNESLERARTGFLLKNDRMSDIPVGFTEAWMERILTSETRVRLPGRRGRSTAAAAEEDEEDEDEEEDDDYDGEEDEEEDDYIDTEE